jgi:hypothetical protein
MNSNFQVKSEKYLEKIKELEKTITFTEETNNIIKKLINEMNYLKVLNVTNINNNNIDSVIKIKINNKYYKFNIQHNVLVTTNDIVESVELSELVNSNSKQIDLTDNNRYGNLIRDIVFLGYIFLKDLNSNIGINSIDDVPPFAQEIINMVSKMNKL